MKIENRKISNHEYNEITHSSNNAEDILTHRMVNRRLFGNSFRKRLGDKIILACYPDSLVPIGVNIYYPVLHMIGHFTICKAHIR
jgi:hypothetical protein